MVKGKLEEFVSRFIEYGVRSYKKLHRNTYAGRCLDRHEAIIVDGVEVSCWCELSVYKMADYLRELDLCDSIECNLDGNDSNITIEITDENFDKLTEILGDFFKENNL